MSKQKSHRHLIIIFIFILIALSGNNATFAQIISTFPHIEDFETSVPPPNWSEAILVSGATQPDWSMVTGSGTNPPASPLANASMAKFNSDVATAGSRARLITPPIQLTGVVHPQMTFNMYHDNLSTNPDSLTIEISTNGITWSRYSNYLRYATINGWTSEAYIINLTPYTGQTIYLSFTGTSRVGNNMYIDFVTIEPGPVCPAPSMLSATNILTNQANLTWTPGASESQWQIEWGQGTFAQGSGTLTPSNTNNFLLSGLTTATLYSYYVRAICGGGDTSTWAGPYSFRTSCGAISVDVTPWTEGFESGYTNGQTSWPCWSESQVTGTNYWTANNVTSYNRTPRTGSMNAAIYYPSENWLFKQFQLTGGITYDFQMYARQYTTTPTNAFIKVKYGTSANATAMTTAIVDSTVITSTGYQRVFGRLTPSVTGIYYIGIYSKVASGALNYLSMDDLSLSVTPACPPPYNFLASAITNNSVNLSWVRYTTHSNVKYKVAGSGTSVTKHNVTSPYPLSGLNQNTDYVAWVQDSCGPASLSAWSDSITFRTTQVPVTLPYSLDFESGAGTWYFENGTQANKWSVGTDTAYNSAHSLYISNDGGTTNAYTITSTSAVHFYHDILFTAGAPAYMLTFDWKGYGQSSYDYLRVFLVDPSTTPVSGTQLTSGQIGTTYYLQYPWQTASIQLPASLAGTIKRLVFSWYNNASSGTQPPAAVDNISLAVLTCPPVTTLSSYNVGVNSVYLTWNAVSGTKWQIEYGPQGFTQGTGTRVWSINDTFNLTGLLASTTYSFYVRSFCSPGDTSIWAGPVSFTTLCDVFAAPFEEHFNTTVIPNCWNISGPQSWLFTKTWPSYGAAAIANTDHTGIGGSFTGVDGSGSAGLTGITLSTPLINISSLTNPRLRFWLFNNNTNDTINYQTLRIDMWNGTSWVNNIYYYDRYQNNASWQEKSVNLSSYTITGPVKFNFVVDKSSGSPFYDDLIMDDVYVENTPSCVYPSTPRAINTSAYNALLSWMPGGAETQWQIEYGTRNFTHGTGTFITSFNDTFNLTGLTPGTAYTFYVRSICGPGDTSTWALPVNFNTSLVPVSVPFSLDFERGSGTWIIENGSQTNKWFVGTATAYNSDTSLYISNDNGLNNTYTITSTSAVHFYNDISFPPGVNPFILSFDWKAYGESCCDYLRVFLIDPSITPVSGTLLTTGQIGSSNYSLQTAWQNASIQIPSSYAGTTKRLLFTWRNDGSIGTMPPAAIDNISLTIFTCPPATALGAVNITSSSADLRWSCPSATQFQVEWGLQNFTHGQGTFVIANNDTFRLSSLNPSTAYKYYVRGICGPGDTSSWAGPYSFTTQCVPYTSVPYSENFESGVFPVCWANTILIPGSGTTPIWMVVTTGTNPGCNPHNGTKMVKFNSNVASAGASARLESGELFLAGLHLAEMSFSMYHDNTAGYITKRDSVAVQVYANNTWNTIGGFVRPWPSNQWMRHSVRLDQYLGQNIKIGFLGVSTLGYNIYLDSIYIMCLPDTATITVAPACITGTATVHSTYNNTQTFFLRDQTGGGVQEWTGFGDSHTFTNVPSGIYRAQVGGTLCTSPLSPAVALNNYNQPSVYYSPPQSQDSVCLWDPAFALQGGYGIPAGGSGFYSGPGVNNNIFSPSAAGAGRHHITYSYTYNGCSGDTFAIITVIVCPGLDELGQAGIRIYPNPADEMLYIDFPEVSEATEMCFYDVKGQLLICEVIPVAAKGSVFKMNTTTYPRGVYFIRILNSKGMIMRKIILK